MKPVRSSSALIAAAITACALVSAAVRAGDAPGPTTEDASAAVKNSAHAFVADAGRVASDAGRLASDATHWVAGHASGSLDKATAFAGRAKTAIVDEVGAVRAKIAHASDEVGSRRVGLLVLQEAHEPSTPSDWTRLQAGDAVSLPPRMVVLVHGLDEPGTIWNELAPALSAQSLGVVRFEYPNDQPIARSADQLGAALADLRARGVSNIDLVCHSMGGLVARDALTRDSMYAGQGKGHGDLPDVAALIMIAPPNHGSPLASLRMACEVREQIARWWDSGCTTSELLGCLSDGDGEAGADLQTNSPFLTDLNARPLPAGVAITIIVGELACERESWVDGALNSVLAGRAMSVETRASIGAKLACCAECFGDGVVAVDSCLLDGVTDVVRVRADHRSIITSFDSERWLRQKIGAPAREPAAIGVVLDRVSRR